MSTLLADTLRKLRTEKGLTQTQLANLMYVNTATISKWESGTRVPDVPMITRLAGILAVDVGTLLAGGVRTDEFPNLVIVDDNRAVLSYNLLILKETVPAAVITGFNWPQQAIKYARTNRIDLAFLDIEMGTASGLDLCSTLIEINPCTKVIYLTAYPEYSLNAWDTDASGFLVKPLTPESIRRQLKKLHIPFSAGGTKA